MSDVILGTILLDFKQVYALIDPSATHSLMARKFESKLNVQFNRIKKWFIINTLLRVTVCVGYKYKGARITIRGHDMKVDLIPLELYNFDVILGLDWLGKYMAQMNCLAKIMTF